MIKSTKQTSVILKQLCWQAFRFALQEDDYPFKELLQPNATKVKGATVSIVANIGILAILTGAEKYLLYKNKLRKQHLTNTFANFFVNEGTAEDQEKLPPDQKK